MVHQIPSFRKLNGPTLMNNAIFFALPSLWDFVKKQLMDRGMLNVHIFLIQT
jgi:hypothetical protein